MARDELTLFSYEILGLVGREGASPHDLFQLARRGRILDWAGESRYYTEPKRLAALGYLDARREPGKTRERTVYVLTDKGVAALREWARTPTRFTPVKSEPMVRLLVADLVGEEPTRQSLGALRDEVADLRARLDDAERTAELLPHRRTNLRLVIEFLRGLLDLHLELVERVEAELGPAPVSRPE